MLGLLPELHGKRVLDAGCGPGVCTQQLIDRGATVVGFDMSDRMLKLAGNQLRNWSIVAVPGYIESLSRLPLSSSLRLRPSQKREGEVSVAQIRAFI